MASKPPPIARKPKNKKQYRAMYDFEGQDTDGYKVLSFEEGDIITWIEDIDEHWIKARVRGQEGIVPKEYVDERASQVFPLHEACRRGNLEQVKQYIADSNPVNSKDNVNGTPIYYAAAAGYLDCVEELLRTTFIDMKIVNNFGETCVHAAAVKGYVDVVERLVKHNDELLSKDNQNAHQDIIAAKNKQGKMAIDLTHDAATKGFLRERSGIASKTFNPTMNVAVSDEEPSTDEE